MHLKNLGKIIFFLSFISFSDAGCKKNALLETAEALLAVAKENEGIHSYCSESEHYFYDFDDAKSISQTIMIEREVNRDVFTSMLVESEREEFIKVAAKAVALLNKWIEVEKALNEDKPALSSSSVAIPDVKKEEKKEEVKPATTDATVKPEEKKPEEAKPLFEQNKDDASGRKPLDIKPPSFLERFKKNKEEKKDEARPVDVAAKPEEKKEEVKPAIPDAMPAASATPPVEVKKSEEPAKPEEKKEAAADAKDDSAGGLKGLRSRRLRGLGKK